jgi:hypothetical protein
MDKAKTTTAEKELLPDGLAKRMFVITMIGVVAYVAVVIMLMTSVD